MTMKVMDKSSPCGGMVGRDAPRCSVNYLLTWSYQRQAHDERTKGAIVRCCFIARLHRCRSSDGNNDILVKLRTFKTTHFLLVSCCHINLH